MLYPDIGRERCQVLLLLKFSQHPNDLVLGVRGATLAFKTCTPIPKPAEPLQEPFNLFSHLLYPSQLYHRLLPPGMLQFSNEFHIQMVESHYTPQGHRNVLKLTDVITS